MTRGSARGRVGERVTVDIRAIAAGGDGVGTLPDGRVVFVPRTAPGDRARVQVRRTRTAWASARLVSLQQASEQRRDAPCRYYYDCGGCSLQHIQYPHQLAAKARIVADALTRIGHIPIDPPEIEASPLEFGYRNRLSFTLVRLAAGRVIAGFHSLRRPDQLLDIAGDCLLPESAIGVAWDGLRARWGADANRLPSGDRLRLTLRSSAAGQVSLFVDGGFAPGKPDELLAGVPQLIAIWHRAENVHEPVLLAGDGSLVDSWAGEPIRIEGPVFVQVNREAGSRLQRFVLGCAGDPRGQKVVDAYCGTGAYARALAALGAEAVGIEADHAAAREARRLAGGAARIEHGRVEDLLSPELPAGLVIVNPPRTGLDASVCATLRERPPTRLIYVSCDPATLARDIARLMPGAKLDAVRCYDLFPQTAHVETVAQLSFA